MTLILDLDWPDSIIAGQLIIYDILYNKSMQFQMMQICKNNW